ncbi:helix-turn-helix domain-containing protein [Streptomyces anulatus]|uniref:helix-turn-helix domain-containing protein n=1 Tax=Streptomyces anulatus TaxID=1892 RepID=UPI002E3100DE|nr:helix-turn-helix domain-containing protein [Streptomyces anulatus]
MDFEIREGREPQGRKKLIRERAAYFRLMQQGVSNTEACRIVGVNRRTGKRWRYGRNPSGGNKAAPPLNAVEPPSVPSRYLRDVLTCSWRTGFMGALPRPRRTLRHPAPTSWSRSEISNEYGTSQAEPRERPGEKSGHPARRRSAWRAWPRRCAGPARRGGSHSHGPARQ